jgi:vancomycin resistance protein YoaR
MRTPARTPLLQILLAITAGLALFITLLLGWIAGYDIVYSGRIYPGVSVAGIDVSGMRQEEAASVLLQRLDYPSRGRIVFQEGSNLWVAKPSEVGFFLDAQTSALAAYQVGRRGDPLTQLLAQYQAWYSGFDLPPGFLYDERQADNYLKGIASQVDRPILEASLGVNGLEVVVHSGQVGRKLDIPAALKSLESQLAGLSDGIITLTVHETPPVILDVTEQAEIAKRILSAPLVLRVPEAAEGDPGPWSFGPPALAAMLAIERVEGADGARYQVGLSPDNLRPFLEGVASSLARSPANARFIFNDDTRQLEVIQPSVTGRALNIDATIQDVNRRLAEGEHKIFLTFDYKAPQVADDATAEQLGITELVSSHTSYFYGSSSARIQNIQTASARFHGVLVPPGATFSMAEVLGDVSLDNGYSEALIIFGGRTIKGVGGGVCQVSTTLFRTVFFGGYPVVDRYPHAYRVGYYEQTPSGGHDPSLAGLDATVFVPVVDFRFTNDTPYWLLMETYVNPSARTLTWKFYSTSDGRSVEWHTTGPLNVVEPPEPLYEENPDLAKGDIVQVDWEAEGADISVSRTVWRDGQVLYEDTFATHYLPWRAVFQYGPGTKGIPTPEEDNH